MAVEIITGIERRRRWSAAEKLRIVAELDEPGACFAEVGRRHELSRGLLWNWQRQVRNGTLALPTSLQFVPVQVLAEPAAPEPPRSRKPSPSARPSAPAEAVIEIALPDGTTVRVGPDVGTAALRRVLGVLRG